MTSETESEKKKEKPPVDSITIEELINSSSEPLQRIIELEMRNAGVIERKVIFRRLSFKEIEALSEIPKDELERYTRSVVFRSSIEPKFEDVDQIALLPSGFVNSYAALILEETGKTPFLVQRSLG